MLTADPQPAARADRGFDWSRPAGSTPAATEVILERRRWHRRTVSVIEVIGLIMLVPIGVLIAAVPILLLAWIGRTVLAMAGGE